MSTGGYWQTYRMRRASAIVSYVFMVALLAVLAWALSKHVDENSQARGRQRQLEQIVACERGNIARGYLLLRARDLSSMTAHTANLAPKLFTIIDCKASVPLRRDVPLSKVETERYLRILIRGEDPIIRHGMEIGRAHV